MNWKKRLDENESRIFIEGISNSRMAFQPRNNLYKEKNWNLFSGEQ